MKVGDKKYSVGWGKVSEYTVVIAEPDEFGYVVLSDEHGGQFPVVTTNIFDTKKEVAEAKLKSLRKEVKKWEKILKVS